MKDTINPNSLFSNITKQKIPPIESWDPPFCGDIDISIKRDGQWYYNGSAISRMPLVKLFARVLKREEDQYFLVTPVEKVRIKVELHPFLTVAVEQKQSNPCVLAFRTNLDEIIVADENHSITVTTDDKGDPVPILHVRNNLHALISRSDFYQLVELATSEPDMDPAHKGGTICSIHSNNCKFILGKY